MSRTRELWEENGEGEDGGAGEKPLARNSGNTKWLHIYGD